MYAKMTRATEELLLQLGAFNSAARDTTYYQLLNKRNAYERSSKEEWTGRNLQFLDLCLNRLKKSPAQFNFYDAMEAALHQHAESKLIEEGKYDTYFFAIALCLARLEQFAGTDRSDLFSLNEQSFLHALVMAIWSITQGRSLLFVVDNTIITRFFYRATPRVQIVNAAQRLLFCDLLRLINDEREGELTPLLDYALLVKEVHLREEGGYGGLNPDHPLLINLLKQNALFVAEIRMMIARLSNESLVTGHNKEGVNFIQQLITSADVLVTTRVLQSIPHVYLSRLLSVRDRAGESTFRYALNNPLTWYNLIKMVPSRELFTTIEQRYLDHSHALYYLLDHTDILKKILFLYLQTNRTPLLSHQRTDGVSVMHLAMKNPEALGCFLVIASDESYEPAWIKKDRDGRTPQDYAETDASPIPLLPPHRFFSQREGLPAPKPVYSTPHVGRLS